MIDAQALSDGFDQALWYVRRTYMGVEVLLSVVSDKIVCLSSPLPFLV